MANADGHKHLNADVFYQHYITFGEINIIPVGFALAVAEVWTGISDMSSLRVVY